MDIKKSFGTDKEKAEKGKWFDLEAGGRVKVAKLNNPFFKAEVARLSKPQASILRSSIDTTEIVDKITVRAMAKTILLEFTGITIDKKPVECNPENSHMLLTEYPDFREMISELSVNRQNFMPEEIAEK